MKRSDPYVSALPCIRLIRVLALTIYHVAGVIAATVFKGRDPSRIARQAKGWAADLVNRLHIDIQIQGKFPDRGVLVVSNHRSYLDIVVILSQIESAFLAKVELRKWPVFGFAAMKGNTVFVDRSDRDSRKASREQIIDRLNQGISVVVFPEGTTSAGPGLLPLKNGIFDITATKNIPVVPVAVCYENKNAAWIDDDTFVRHFLDIFKTRPLKSHLIIGPVLTKPNAADLKASCYHFIEQALASKDNSPAV